MRAPQTGDSIEEKRRKLGNAARTVKQRREAVEVDRVETAIVRASLDR
jgi:hypothetical protein